MEVDGNCASMEVDGNSFISMEADGSFNGSRWKFPWK